jgi:hypothetical protein
MKEIKNTILYCVFVRTFVILYHFILRFRFRLFNNKLRSRFSTQQKVTVPTVLVAQHCLVGTGGEAGGGQGAALAAHHRLRHLCHRVQ